MTANTERATEIEDFDFIKDQDRDVTLLGHDWRLLKGGKFVIVQESAAAGKCTAVEKAKSASSAKHKEDDGSLSP
ncbi:MAG: hypothetical protein U0694_18790 [Anaerolineae bacterium]